MTCDDFRNLPPGKTPGLRELQDCERHMQFCPGCRQWLKSAPDSAAYRMVRIHWAQFLAWINKGRPESLYQ